MPCIKSLQTSGLTQVPLLRQTCEQIVIEQQKVSNEIGSHCMQSILSQEPSLCFANSKLS